MEADMVPGGVRLAGTEKRGGPGRVWGPHAGTSKTEALANWLFCFLSRGSSLWAGLILTLGFGLRSLGNIWERQAA